MATVTASFLFSIPEDKDSNYIKIWSATSEGGTYTQETMLTYKYAARAVEYTSLDTTKWYKVQFNNSSTGVNGPISDPVFGGAFDHSKPFVAITTSFDGAGLATTDEVYECSNLTSADVSVTDVRNALDVAGAYIDLTLGDTNLHRYSRVYSSNIARRKYNAQLAIMRKIEIAFALALIYKDLADDEIMKTVRDQKKQFNNITVGQTSLTLDEPTTNINIANFLDNQAQRYNAQAAQLLSTILPTTVPLLYNGELKVTWLDVYSFSGAMGSSSAEASVSLESETLTGAGGSMNDSWHNLTSILLTTTAIIEDSYLLVNGVQYSLDSWINSEGTTVGSGDDGFSLDVQTSTHKIRWNNTAANGGFDLENADTIELKYWN